MLNMESKKNYSRRYRKVNKEELKNIFRIQESLKVIGYNDIIRISKEILQYCSDEQISIDSVLERLKTQEPWEYIRGKVEFCGNDFYVNKHTLIPRLETENLVDLAISLCKKNNYSRIIDIGTGSGCIIISIAKTLPTDLGVEFLATDISTEALKIAKRNTKRNLVEGKIRFLQTNLLKNIDLTDNTLYLANLPYIPSSMYKNLDRSVLEYEPPIALEGGENGLFFYEELLKQLSSAKEGIASTLVIEIEPSTLPQMHKLLQEYKHEVLKDFRGLDRFVLIHLS